MAVSVASAELIDLDTRPPSAAAPAGMPLRCIILDGESSERRRLVQIAAASRHALACTEAASIAAARAVLRGGALVDFMVIGHDMPDGDGIEFAAELARDPLFTAIPVIILSSCESRETAVRAMRCGAADILSRRALDLPGFDHAVEAAMRRVARGPAGAGHLRGAAADDALMRRVTLRNMRLLKTQAMPVLALAWKMVAGGEIDESEQPALARRLARLTRNVTGLIDDTAIIAATLRADAATAPVDLDALVREIAAAEDGPLVASHARVRIEPLPVLDVRRAHFEMLFKELLIAAARAAQPGEVPDVEIGWAPDPDGNPVIWLHEHGVDLSGRKQEFARRSVDLRENAPDPAQDEFCWSLCQRLVEKNRGEFRISRDGANATRVMMRFHREMLVEPT